MNAGNDNVQCSPLSRGRRPKEINCCLVYIYSFLWTLSSILTIAHIYIYSIRLGGHDAHEQAIAYIVSRFGLSVRH